MKRLAAFFVLAVCTAGAQAEWLSTGGLAGSPETRILLQSELRTVFEVTVPGVEAVPVEQDGAGYTMLELPGEVMAVLTEGRPQVPKVSVLLAIPGGASVSARATVLETRTLRVPDVYPLQPPLIDGEEPAPFVIDQAFYSRDIAYPDARVQVIETGTWRDLDVATLQVYPVQVNPGKGEVEVATRIRVEVGYSGGRYPDRITDWLVPTYARFIDNFKELRLLPADGFDYTPGVRYLVFSHSSYANHSLLNDSLLGWVRQRGYEVRVISKSSFTAAEIKDSIRAEYNRNSPSLLRWVLLVGEYGEIPMGSYSSVAYSDFWYSDILPTSGGDNYPEVGVARLSPSSGTDLTNQVRKILKYQKSPPATNSWLNKLTMVANHENYPGKYSGCVRGIYRMPKPYWNPATDTIMGKFHTSNTPITNAVNAGVGILAYRGHGSRTMWGVWTPNGVSWTNSDVGSLSNDSLTPVVYNVCCDNGGIFSSLCLSEQWMRKCPGGAVASLGATQGSYTYPNHGMCSTLVRATCDTWTIKVPGVRDYHGPVFDIAGIMMYMDAYAAKYWPRYQANIWMYLMLGDPSTPVWAGGMPQVASIAFPQTITTGLDTIAVTVRVDGQPVEGALVCAWKDSEVYVSERTGASGVASLVVNPRTTGAMLLTVSEGHARHSTGGVTHTPIFPSEDTITVRSLLGQDVGATVVLAPSGTIDSTQSVAPECSVHNYGSTTETYPVRMRIGTYNETATVTSHAPGETRYVTFPAGSDWPRGTITPVCSTECANDADNSNDRAAGHAFVRVLDARADGILAPTGVVRKGTAVVPRAVIRNDGNTSRTFNVRFTVGDGYADIAAVTLDAAAQDTLSFASWTPAAVGAFTTACSTMLAGDMDNTDDLATGTVMVRSFDACVVAIAAPVGRVDTNRAVMPSARVKNCGAVEMMFRTLFVIADVSGTELYRCFTDVARLSAGAESTLTFPAWAGSPVEAEFMTRCSLAVTDANPTNDTLHGRFTVAAAPDWPRGWVEVASMPLSPSGRPVKRGGWLEVNPSTGLLYGQKGYKTNDFYCYDPYTDVWDSLSGMPFQTHALWGSRPPRKGSKGVSDGGSVIYVTQGNNTLGFWSYHIAQDSWSILPDVPLGKRRKKIKGGSDMVYLTEGDTGYVYLLKGYKNEFYRFNTVSEAWEPLENAPVGIRDKYDKGSWLVCDAMTDASNLLLHKSKYHEFYEFRRDSLKWDQINKGGMPFIGMTGRKKRSKDGGSAAFHDGRIFALKGGNTQEFWMYDPGTGQWTELDTMPAWGSTGRKKRVKYGADIVSYGNGAFFALKGNKTSEVWRYVIPFAAGSRPARPGIMGAAVKTRGGYGFELRPNPLVGGVAFVRYNLAKAGPAKVSVLDVSGRAVETRCLLAGCSGAVGLDLRSLAAGVYLVRLDADGFTDTQKLVINR